MQCYIHNFKNLFFVYKGNINFVSIKFLKYGKQRSQHG